MDKDLTIDELKEVLARAENNWHYYLVKACRAQIETLENPTVKKQNRILKFLGFGRKEVKQVNFILTKDPKIIQIPYPSGDRGFKSPPSAKRDNSYIKPTE